MVQGDTEKGAIRYEKAMKGSEFLKELKKRGINLQIQVTTEVDTV